MGGPSEPVYLDNQATTRIDPRVLDAMRPYLEDHYGNAASRAHAFGWRAEAAVEQARESLAGALGVSAREIVFTSGATEANNLAILGVARAASAQAGAAGTGAAAGHVVTSAIEHLSVLDPVKALGRQGFDTTVVRVDGEGRVDPDAVADALRDDTRIVSVMAANNEIGVLEPVAEIGARCAARGVPFHSDAAQIVGKLPFDLGSLPIDLASLCAHKLHGPKGIGALFVRRRRPRIRIEPLMYGGGHERGLRAGTLPVALVVGLARAVEIAVEDVEAEAARIRGLRERLRGALEKGLDGVHWNGSLSERLPGNLNVAFDGVPADSLLLALRDVALSTGSACSSADPRPSHVLLALGLPERRVRESVRIGIGRFQDEAEIDRVASRIVEEVRKLRATRSAAVGSRVRGG